MRLPELRFMHGSHVFSLLPRISPSPSGTLLTLTIVHRPPAASGPPLVHLDVGLILSHARGTRGVFDVLTTAPSDEVVVPGMLRVTLHAGHASELLEGGFLLSDGALPLTLLLQEPVRDRGTVARGGAKRIVGRPTSIQPWQYERESPPLRHWHGDDAQEVLQS